MSPTAWRGRLATFGDAVRWAPPAPAIALRRLQAALGVAAPDELRPLRAESDALADHDGAAVVWRAADLETFLTSILRR